MGKLLAVLLAVPWLAQGQTPVFRSGVDLVTVDVVVVDKSGAPVTDLTAADFMVLAAKKPRRIVSVDYVGTDIRTSVPSGPDEPKRAGEPGGRGISIPAPSSNARRTMAAGGRTIIFAVDVEEIRAGMGRGVMKDIGGYLDRLAPADRVGIISLPSGTPRVDPTTDRTQIKKSAEAIVGTSRRYEMPDACSMTPGEAQAIVNDDPEGAKAFIERRPPPPRCPPPEMGGDLSSQARHALNRFEHHTRAVLDALGAIAKAMAPLDGAKSLVLVSEGIVNNVDLAIDLQDFARLTDQARVSLYSLHLDAPLVEAATQGGNTIRSRLFDDHLGMDSMVEISHAARGTALRVVGSATNALAQIDRELSGHYLLSFEREPTDKDGARVGIEVKINRPGLDIRARREFTAAATAATPTPVAPKDPRAAMGELLKWPATIGDVRLDLDAVVQPVAGSSTDARALIVAEIAHGGRKLTAVGYEIRDGRNQTVTDSFDVPPTVGPIDDRRALYLVAQPLAPGTYQLKLGVLDEGGRRGSIDHSITVPAWTPAEPRVSDLMIGDVSTGTFRPTANLGAGASRVGVRLEVHGDAPGMLDGVEVDLLIEKVGETGAVERQSLTLSGTNDPRARQATTVLDILGYSSGQYVVTATVRTRGTEMATRRRLFTK